ncbi:MAG: hypothetical protein KAV82_16495 [Phycisphaerae bacterium]|nr:hypothetical protein [Phycisphaerae bacterium]
MTPTRILHPAGAITLAKYSPTQLAKYAESLQRRNTESIGFLSRTALQTYARRGNIMPCTLNGDLVAFSLFYDGTTPNRPRVDPYDLRIYQHCVQYDARLLYVATRLLNNILDHALRNDFHRIRLWCRDTLPANDFWRTCGFTLEGTRLGGHKRQAVQNLWVLKLVDNPAESKCVNETGFVYVPED